MYLNGSFHKTVWVSDADLRSFQTSLSAANGNYTIRAFWGSKDGQYIESDPFHVGNTVTVTFNLNGRGSNAPAPQSVIYGETATEPDYAPVLTGYYLDGWFTDADCTEPYDFSTPVTQDMILYARWSPRTFTLSFNANGGSGTQQSITAKYGDTITMPQCTFTPAAGKTFLYWNYNSKFYYPGKAVTVVNGASITAVWTIANVVFNANGGSGTMNAMTPDYQGKITLPQCGFTAPEDMRFDRWSIGAPGETVTIYGNTVVRAIWKDKTYSVALNAGVGGSGTMSSVTTDSKGVLTVPACTFTAPAGKEFSAWFAPTTLCDRTTLFPGETAQLKGDGTLTALWRDKNPDTVTISFSANGGSGEMQSITCAYGETVVMPECLFTPPEGCRFKYWNLGAAYNYYKNAGAEVTPSGNVTATAVWETIVYRTVEFNNMGHGGTTPETQTVPDGERLTDPGELSEIGWEFTGWYTLPNCQEQYRWDFSSPVDNTVTGLYAGWTQLKYPVEVTVISGEGTASANREEAAMGSVVSVSTTPADGWELEKITVYCDGETQTLTSYYFTMGAGDAQVSVFFKEKCAHAAMIHYEDIPRGCYADGRSEYWYCPDCGKLFWDEDGAYEISNVDWLTLPAEHRFEEGEPYCLNDCGTKNPYYHSDILGDANADGRVDIGDATAIQRHAAGIEEIVYSTYEADVDNDGEITVADATLLQRFLAGYSSEYSIGEQL